MDIIITIPAKIKWDDYQKELEEAEKGGTLNWKTPSFPTRVKVGDRCFVTHRNEIKGHMIISGFSEKEFICSTTGTKWKGKFIERSGKFFPYEGKLKDLPGFRGFKYYKGWP